MNQVTLGGTLKQIIDRKEKVTIIMVNISTMKKSSDIQVALFGRAMHQVETLSIGCPILLHGYVTSNLSKDGSKVYNGIGASDIYIAPKESDAPARQNTSVRMDTQALGAAPVGQASLLGDDDIPF